MQPSFALQFFFASHIFFARPSVNKCIFYRAKYNWRITLAWRWSSSDEFWTCLNFIHSPWYFCKIYMYREVNCGKNGCAPFSVAGLYINTGRCMFSLRGKWHFRATGNLLFRFRISWLIATSWRWEQIQSSIGLRKTPYIRIATRVTFWPINFARE